jgi:hypothetical protein
VFGVRDADMGDDVSEAWRLYRLACEVADDEPIGVTIAEWVRFRRSLRIGGVPSGRTYVGSPMIAGRRVVLIPSGWAA